jgi:hypothetical protein
MRRPLKLFLYTAATFLLASAFAAGASAQSPERDLSGSVRDAHHHPISGATVELENEATEAVESYLTDADGHYNFKRVRGDTDYRVWAIYQGHRSKTRDISKFSTNVTPFVAILVELP